MFDLMQSVELLHILRLIAHKSWCLIHHSYQLSNNKVKFSMIFFGTLDEGGLFGADGRLLNCTGHSSSCSNQTSV